MKLQLYNNLLYIFSTFAPQTQRKQNMKKFFLMMCSLLVTGALHAQGGNGDFVKGADVGFLAGQEQRGVKFHDRQGHERLSDVRYPYACVGQSSRRRLRQPCPSGHGEACEGIRHGFDGRFPLQ